MLAAAVHRDRSFNFPRTGIAGNEHCKERRRVPRVSHAYASTDDPVTPRHSRPPHVCAGATPTEYILTCPAAEENCTSLALVACIQFRSPAKPPATWTWPSPGHQLRSHVSSNSFHISSSRDPSSPSLELLMMMILTACQRISAVTRQISWMLTALVLSLKIDKEKLRVYLHQRPVVHSKATHSGGKKEEEKSL